MKTVILCGGMGTRIRDVSKNMPKPMVAIGRQPILWHIMKIYSHYGFNDFILCLGYKGQIIKDFFFNYYATVNDCTVDLSKPNGVNYHDGGAREEWTVTLADTGIDTMTGARVARIKKYLDNDEDFMLTYGDGLADIDIKAVVEFHKSHGKMVTVTGVHPAGVMEGKRLAKGNPRKRNASRTQSRSDAPSVLERVRRAAAKDQNPLVRFGVII
jgi:glucose-1-phosphate cytidylyltransferase